MRKSLQLQLKQKDNVRRLRIKLKQKQRLLRLKPKENVWPPSRQTINNVMVSLTHLILPQPIQVTRLQGLLPNRAMLTKQLMTCYLQCRILWITISLLPLLPPTILLPILPQPLLPLLPLAIRLLIKPQRPTLVLLTMMEMVVQRRTKEFTLTSKTLLNLLLHTQEMKIILETQNRSIMAKG